MRWRSGGERSSPSPTRGVSARPSRSTAASLRPASSSRACARGPDAGAIPPPRPLERRAAAADDRRLRQRRRDRRLRERRRRRADAIARAARMRTSTSPSTGPTQLTAHDHARLFLRIDRLTPRRHRAYFRNLLASIVSYQRWGIAPVAASRGFHVMFKGGWRLGTFHQVALLEREGSGRARGADPQRRPRLRARDAGPHRRLRAGAATSAPGGSLNSERPRPRR